MKITSALRVALVALTAFAGTMLSTAAHADEGFVQLTIYKAGWIIGGSGGSGVLDFRRRRYSLSTGGLDYGLVFGGSKMILRGRVSNIWRPSDVAGVYGAGGRRPRDRPRRARDRAEQPEGCGAGTDRTSGGTDGERGLSGLAITMR